MTLNGPSRIYHLRPVFQLPANMETKSPMYSMRNLHDKPAFKPDPASTPESQTDGNEGKILADVLRRQQELINTLQSIQSRVSDLKLELTSTSKLPSKDSVDGGGFAKQPKKPLKCASNNVPAQLSKDAPLDTKNIAIKNPVINLSPLRPAYSLLTLSHIWNNVFKSQSFTMHIHSSVNEIPRAFRALVKPDPSRGNKENSLFDMRLIWKDITDTELISSPLKQSNVTGEVSVLRLFQSMFSSHDTGVDSALNLCHQLLYTSEKDTALALVKKLADLLGSNEWMLGSSSLGVVDAAAWSAILNVTHLVQTKQLGPNLTKWSQKINALVGITSDMLTPK